jgi:hypothetical protein
MFQSPIKISKIIFEFPLVFLPVSYRNSATPNGYYAAELSYLRIGNDELASEVRNLRRENEALKAQLMELNNGVLPEQKPDFSSLLLVREPKPLAKQDRRKKRKAIFVEKQV